MVSGTDDELYRKTINPIDKPQLSVQSVDIAGAVTKALGERTDMVIARKNLDIRRLNLQQACFQFSHTAVGADQLPD